MNQPLSMEGICKKAVQAARAVAYASSRAKVDALYAIAEKIHARHDQILKANDKDFEDAKNLSKALADRLKVTGARINSIVESIKAIAQLPDPVGKKLASWERPNGLKISRVSVPLGVIGIIYESRPNVTADAASICIMSGNAAILRGGSESFHSSNAIMNCIRDGLKAVNLPPEIIQYVPTRDRQAVGEMLKMRKYIDVIIPRGGKSLCARVQEESLIPTLQHLDGNCHTYIHEKADFEKARRIVLNAKMRRTGICGATESLVIDQAIAKALLPLLAEDLTASGCALRGDEAACAIGPRIQPAAVEDWNMEYLDAILSIKVVKDIEQAIAFINQHSSHHTEAIISEDEEAAAQFLRLIESAIVMHNTSTQFADGGEFGLGGEIGVSTGKLHARGPVSVQELTTYKYVVEGDGQIRPAD